MIVAQHLTLRIGALAALLALVACGSEKPEIKGKRPSQGDANALRTPPPRDTMTSQARAEYRDSAGLFNPDGYYVPEQSVIIEGHQIGSLELHTVDLYYEGESHYDRPRLVQPPAVFLALSRSNEDGQTRYPCAARHITPDSLSVNCPATPMGDMQLEGHFLDRAGKYWNNLAYEQRPTVLLVARLVVTKNGSVIHDQVHRFTYTAGD